MAFHDGTSHDVATFLALQVQSVVLVNASVWSVQFDHFLVFFVLLTADAPCPVICKSVGTCPRASASLSSYSFTPESIIKQPFNLNA